MSKREQYKHLLNGFSNFILLAIQTTVFGYIWYHIYVPKLKDPFWNRGNWAVIGMYFLVLFFFNRVLGAYRMGYLRITDICISQILASICANVVEYFQICMIANDYMKIEPLLIMTVIEVMVIVPLYMPCVLFMWDCIRRER